LYRGEKLSRKQKRAVLGKRLNRSTLKKRIGAIKLIPQPFPQSTIIEPYPFCPKCGCTVVIGSGNKALYPEAWYEDTCARCNFLVGVVDNSPYYHVLEYGGGWQ